MAKISIDGVGSVTGSVEKLNAVPAVELRQDFPQGGNPVAKQAAKHEAAAAEEGLQGTQDINKAVQDLNEHMQVVQRELHFSIDEDSGKTVIKVMDLETRQVIRQIPNEEALSVARKLTDGDKLQLFNRYT